MNSVKMRIMLYLTGLATGFVLACLATGIGSETHALVLRTWGVNTKDFDIAFWILELGLAVVAMSATFSGAFEELPPYDLTFTARTVLRNTAVLPFETALIAFILGVIIAPPIGGSTVADVWVSPRDFWFMFFGFIPLLFIVRDLAFDIGIARRGKRHSA